MSDTLNAAKSLVPFFNGDPQSHKKADYLAFRFTGFATREAAKLVGVTERSVQNWRSLDPAFLEMERAATGPERVAIRREVIHTLFVRNLSLALHYDYTLLRRLLGLDTVEVTLADGTKAEKAIPLTSQELAYVTRTRANYTPQQLQALTQSTELPDGGGSYLSFVERIVKYQEVHVGSGRAVRPVGDGESIFARAASDAESEASSSPQLGEGTTEPRRDSGREEEA